MSRCRVYLIPSPIGDQITDFSMAALRALPTLEHLFVEADDEFLARMRRKRFITERHHVYVLSDPVHCVERAGALVSTSTSFGILASSGLPCFVDPGHEVVEHLLLDHLDEVELVPVGMSSALDAALAMSGKNIQQFLFLGHVPEFYTMSQSLASHRLPMIYFVRGPAIPQFFAELATLKLPLDRLLLFRDIRKKSRFSLKLLRSFEPPPDLVTRADADYVAVILPVEP